MPQACEPTDGLPEDDRVAGDGDGAPDKVGEHITHFKAELALQPFGERHEDPAKTTRVAVPPPLHRIGRQGTQGPSEPSHFLVVRRVHLLGPAGQLLECRFVGDPTHAKARPKTICLLLWRFPLASRDHSHSGLDGSKQIGCTRMATLRVLRDRPLDHGTQLPGRHNVISGGTAGHERLQDLSRGVNIGALIHPLSVFPLLRRCIEGCDDVLQPRPWMVTQDGPVCRLLSCPVSPKAANVRLRLRVILRR
jgi:hypothetical protein